jgi:predicted dithiol-disulfide oxidoreductase (DUF899 family)
MQRQSLDRHALLASFENAVAMALTPSKTLENLKSRLNWKSIKWLNSDNIDPSGHAQIQSQHQPTGRLSKRNCGLGWHHCCIKNHQFRN